MSCNSVQGHIHKYTGSITNTSITVSQPKTIDIQFTMENMEKQKKTLTFKKLLLQNVLHFLLKK